jgi:hypothetical protein
MQYGARLFQSQNLGCLSWFWCLVFVFREKKDLNRIQKYDLDVL